MARILQGGSRSRDEQKYQRKSVVCDLSLVERISSVIQTYCENIYYLTDDYSYDSLDELQKHEGDSPDELSIIGRKEGDGEFSKYSSDNVVVVNFFSFRTELTWKIKDTENLRGFESVREMLEKLKPARTDFIEKISLGLLVFLGYLYTAILVLASLNKEVPYWLWACGILVFITTHISIYKASSRKGHINLSTRRGFSGFWDRNREDIIKLLIAAIFGGLFTAIFGYYIK